MQDLSVILLAVCGFAIVFALFWTAIVHLISRLSGWSALARRFPANRPETGDAFHWASARLNWFSSYSRCLNVTLSFKGIHLQPVVFFRAGHAPLLIPWNAVKDVRFTSTWLFSSARLVIGSDRDDWTQTITLYGGALTRGLQRHANARLP